MKAVVIYESMYRNTREIAEAIAAGIATLDARAAAFDTGLSYDVPTIRGGKTQ